MKKRILPLAAMTALLATFLLPPLQAQKISNFLGANITREDPVHYLNCVGFAREYHSWVIDEGDVNQTPIPPPPGAQPPFENCFTPGDEDNDGSADCLDANSCSCASGLYPFNVCKWNPGYQGASNEHFHSFYPLVASSLGSSLSAGDPAPICVSLNHTLPQLLNFVPNAQNTGAAAEYKPLFPTGFATDDPRSYEYYADYLTQFALHFGGPATSAVPTKQPNEPLPASALVGYIEPWNEPDKTSAWYPGATGPQPNQIGFTKEEYAALAKAVYNGNNGAMDGDLPGGSHYTLGVSNFPQVKMVMAGVSEFDDANLAYINEVLTTVPQLKVVNVHHYCDSQWSGIGGGGLSPERDQGTVGGASRTFKQALAYVNSLYFSPDPELDHELWLSEFGWDTNNNSPQNVPEIVANGQVADQQEVQGCWIVRGFLEARAAGVDKAMVYFLRDADSGPEGGLFQASGLVKDKTSGYQPKKSYWYVSTLKNVLGETTFTAEMSNDPISTAVTEPRVLKFEGQVPGFSGTVKVFAVWSPTQSNANYQMTGASFFAAIGAEGNLDATMIRMQPNDPNGERIPLTVANDRVLIPAAEVNERPIFVVLGASVREPVLACLDFVTEPVDNNPTAPYTQSLACDAVKVVWNVPAGQAFDHYLVYYYDRNDSSTPSPLTFNIGDPYWKLYTGDLPGTCNQVVLAGLSRPYDDVPVVVIGVTADGVLTPACPVHVATAACKGEAVIQPTHFTVTPGDCAGVLFDYSNIDFCSAAPTPAGSEWSGTLGSTCSVSEVIVTFDAFYQLDVIRLLDGTSDGLLEIYYDTDNNNSNFDNDNAPLLFNTNYYNVWRNVVFPLCGTGVRRLKFKMNTANTARIQKIVFYGASVATGSIAPGCCGSAAALALTNQSSDQVPGLGTAQEIVVGGTLTINGSGFTFGQVGGSDGPDFFMKPGSKIVVNPNATLTIQGNSLLQGCDKMWQGIEVKPGGKVIFNGSTIRDAYKAFRVMRATNNSNPMSQVALDQSNVWANFYGLFVDPVVLYGGTLSLSVNSTQFDGLGQDLKPFYPGQPEWDFMARAGIYGTNTGLLPVKGTAGNPSLFQRMDFGIYGLGVTLDVSNTRFEQIQARTKNGAAFGGDGIYLFKSSLYHSGFGKYAAYSFDKVSTAFRFRLASVSIKDNHAHDVDFGIVANGISTIGGNIRNNTFVYKKGGMSLNTSSSPVIVTGNSLIAANNKATFGIAASGVANNVTDGQAYDIRDNFLEVRGENVLPPPPVFGAGIYLNNTRNANVENNTVNAKIYELGATGGAEHPLIHGIYVSNSPDNTLCSNNISGVTGHVSGKDGYGKGIALLNAPNNKISCNVVDSIRIGLELRMNCNTPNGIQGNILLNTDKGIVAAENPGAAVVQGAQNYRGNLWINDPVKYAVGASYEGDPLVMLDEQFTVNSNGTTSYTDPSGGATYTLSALPPSYTANWFVPEFLQSNFICGETGNQSCKDNRLGRRLGGEGRYKDIAKGLDNMNDLTAVNQWMIRRSIYGDLRERYAGLTVPGDFSAFYNAQYNSNVQKAWELDREMARIGRGNAAALGRVGVLDSLTWLALNTNQAPAAAWLHERDSLANTIQQQAQTEVALAKVLNQNLSVGTAYESLEKEINAIYLNDFAGQETVATTHLARIEEVSDLCPETDGLAVFKARGMYLMAGGLPRSAWEVCNAEAKTEERELEQAVAKPVLPEIRVFPNPASTVLYVTTNLPVQAYRVHNTLGTLVMGGVLKDSSNSLDISVLPNGVYFLVVEGATRTTLRFVIAH